MLVKDSMISLVKDSMISIDKVPIVDENAILKEALEAMCDLKIGICCIIKNKKIKGIITDGDIRRKILSVQKPISAFLVDDAIIHAVKNPIILDMEQTVSYGIKIMEKYLIWDIPIIDKKNILQGLLHLHPIVKKLLI